MEQKKEQPLLEVLDGISTNGFPVGYIYHCRTFTMGSDHTLAMEGVEKIVFHDPDGHDWPTELRYPTDMTVRSDGMIEVNRPRGA